MKDCHTVLIIIRTVNLKRNFYIGFFKAKTFWALSSPGHSYYILLQNAGICPNLAKCKGHLPPKAKYGH